MILLESGVLRVKLQELSKLSFDGTFVLLALLCVPSSLLAHRHGPSDNLNTRGPRCSAI